MELCVTLSSSCCLGAAIVGHRGGAVVWSSYGSLDYYDSVSLVLAYYTCRPSRSSRSGVVHRDLMNQQNFLLDLSSRFLDLHRPGAAAGVFWSSCEGPASLGSVGSIYSLGDPGSLGSHSRPGQGSLALSVVVLDLMPALVMAPM